MHTEEPYHSLILEFLAEKGVSGVTAIANGIGKSPSSVDKYLKRQTYFMQTSTKKWDIPERLLGKISEGQATTKLGLLAQTLLTQTVLVETHWDVLDTVIKDMIKQMAAIGPILQQYQPPVTDVIDSRLTSIDRKAKETMSLIAKYSEKIPDQYRQLLLNLDIVQLIIDKDQELLSHLNTAISGLLLQKETTLSFDMLSLVKEYQR